MLLKGTRFGDSITGSSDPDIFRFQQGGNDSVSGLQGDDLFRFGAAFTGLDEIDGGDGQDRVTLRGDYSQGLTLGANTLVNIERLRLADAFSFDITSNDANVAAGSALRVWLQGSGGRLTFDGSAETDGRFHFSAGALDDDLTGGRRGDWFVIGQGGDDRAFGAQGRDLFVLDDALTGADSIDGGRGYDTVRLEGPYGALTINSAMMFRVEALEIAGGNGDLSLTIQDAVVRAGESLRVDAGGFGVGEDLIFDGLAETDGTHDVLAGLGADYLGGGTGVDTLVGGGGDDTIEGWGGGDDITGGAGADLFFYKGNEFSTGSGYDVIRDVDFDADRFSASGVDAIDPAVAGVTMNAATFNADLTAATLGQLSPFHAILVTAGAGDLAGRVFLVLDSNESPGYQADADYVFEVTGFVGTIDPSDFI